MIHRTLLVLTAITGMAGSAGCLAVAAGAVAGIGTYAYVKGELKSTFEAGIERTYAAARKAVDQLGFTVKQEGKDALEGRIVAHQADGTEVKINLTRKGENLTEVGVRVGTFGNESHSRIIMDKIKANL